jgi:5-methylcytosine-specific restriction endonuclease McrA
MACKAASQRRDKVTLTCKACGREFERFPSEVRKAFIREADGPYCGRECRGNVMSERQKGEANPSWKGGITPERQKLRYGKKNADWRKAVLERDNYTCRSCGARSEPGKFVLMHAHHIKGFAEYPELRFDIDNGMTLCVPCHFKIHKRKRWIIG